jgi:hypothetical protein
MKRSNLKRIKKNKLTKRGRCTFSFVIVQQPLFDTLHSIPNHLIPESLSQLIYSLITELFSGNSRHLIKALLKIFIRRNIVGHGSV